MRRPGRLPSVVFLAALAASLSSALPATGQPGPDAGPPPAGPGFAYQGAGGGGGATPVDVPDDAVGAGTESVIGADGRTQVTDTTQFPSRAIGQITFDQGAVSDLTCTGW